MKSLKDFEKELNKCSKCGLCQAVCPLFELNHNECAVSKGKFTMLHGVAKGDLKLSENINKYLDMCLKCGKCNKFCPSAIDVCKILSVAKYEYMHDTFFGKVINLLMSRKVFNNIIRFGALLSKPFRPYQKSETGLNVLYFKGCVNKICPKTDKYIAKIFKNIPINIHTPEFECCGLPFLSEGNLERFEQAAKYNLELMKGEYDYVVADCASCQSTIMDYPKYLDSTNQAVNVRFWGNIIAEKGIKFKFKKNVTVTFHKPCHLEDDSFIDKIFSNCENINYIKMEDYDACCGFAGSFGIKNRNLSVELSKKKAENIKNTGADYVITSCPSCILGLSQGLFLTGGKTKVVSLLEFLAGANEII